MTLRSPAVLVELVESLEIGLALFEPDGTPIHRSPALERTLAEPVTGERLGGELESIVRALVNRVRRRQLDPTRHVQWLERREVLVDGSPYRLSGCYIDSAAAGEEALAVSVERDAAGPPPGSAMRRRFALTAQEARVARLLALGRSNAQIAAELHLSPHTVRNHTRRVLGKLSVRTRAEVGPRLREA